MADFGYEILKANGSDAGEILRLQYAAYQSEAAIYNNYSIQPLMQTLEQIKEEFKNSTVLKAVLNGEIIGSVRATVQSDAGIYIGKLIVLPAYQNRGIGKQLLQAIENEFKGKRYWLMTGNKSERNLKMYEKQGYTRFKTEEAAPGLSFVYLEKKIRINLVKENKKDYLPLLLLGDEQESQIDKYLERGDLFALYHGDLKSVCVVTDEGGGTIEIQNLATDQRYQRQGYASSLIDHIAKHYTGRYDKIILGTGDVPGILAYYERRGFAVTHRVTDYFTTHYDQPIIEDGVLLKDKVYLERKLMADAPLKFDTKSVGFRPEQPADYSETENITREAFWNYYVPGCDEHYLLHIMRGSAAFVPELDFVAAYNDKIIGNIVYAKAVIVADDGSEYEVLGMGPISVLPEFQNKGVGGSLIELTKQIARDKGYRAILLYGDPLYYSRHGFVAAEGFDVRTSDNMYAEALQVCELYEKALAGITGRYFENEVYEIDKEAAAEFDKGFPAKEKVSGLDSQKRFLDIAGSRRARDE